MYTCTFGSFIDDWLSPHQKKNTAVDDDPDQTPDCSGIAF